MTVRRSRPLRLVHAALAVAVAAGATAAVSSAASGQQAASGDQAVVALRIVARKLENGRIEFGLQQRQTDDSWGDRQLPGRRFFPTTAEVGRWLSSSTLTVGGSGTVGAAAGIGEADVRIIARRLENGRVEFGLQQRRDDSWGDRLLPRRRFFPTTAEVGRWLSSSAVTVSPETVATPPDNRLTAISVGQAYACGLRGDGTIVCWGQNDLGQTEPPAGEFTSIDAGKDHACAIRADRTVACWGNNNQGQTDAPASEFLAVAAAGGDQGARDNSGRETFRDVGRFSCGVLTDKTLRCWGNNDWGQRNAPSGEFEDVAAGDTHACALRTDGSLRCWGRDHFAVTRPPSGEFTAVSAGWTASCGLRSNGRITCWGDNGMFGELDAPAGECTVIAAGGGHICALRDDGTVHCWGASNVGQTDVPTGEFIAVSAGNHTNCALRANGTIACWGHRASVLSEGP